MPGDIELAGQNDDLEGTGINSDYTRKDAEDVVWLKSLKEKLASTYKKSFPSFTICRVPANIRKGDHAAYNPMIVSIGPFHRRRKNLQAMEEHKRYYLYKVLARSKQENNLDMFLKEMKKKEKETRDCYSGNIKMSSNEFIEMMILDGCFVIQIIHQQRNYVARNDPIYRNISALSRIGYDMVLLENQLPFFVLECLWELSGEPRGTLRYAALTFFEDVFTEELEMKHSEALNIYHLLHLVQSSLKPASPNSRFQSRSAPAELNFLQNHQDVGKILPFLHAGCLVNTQGRSPAPDQECLPVCKDKAPPPWKMIPSATELQEAGVKFKRKKCRSLFKITFKRGLMEMPRLWISDSTNTLFRNFIAFEQCFPEWGNDFTSYCIFIDFLVNTPRDVSILRQSDIIRHGLGSNEEVALLFNNLCKDIAWYSEESFLANTLEEVIQYTKNDIPKWRAKVVRDYCSSPCATLSLIAATTILIFTFLQTYFTVFAYFRPPNP